METILGNYHTDTLPPNHVHKETPITAVQNILSARCLLHGATHATEKLA